MRLDGTTVEGPLVPFDWLRNSSARFASQPLFILHIVRRPSKLAQNKLGDEALS